MKKNLRLKKHLFITDDCKCHESQLRQSVKNTTHVSKDAVTNVFVFARCQLLIRNLSESCFYLLN
ncbi:MAG: hypothetical protein PHU62_04945 [Bacteroidales bacterium]|nr:hypothetical protein [Bacteroidales bacterium]MDD4633908.1 hypothetical protein [Bacteroidales bacterium]